MRPRFNPPGPLWLFAACGVALAACATKPTRSPAEAAFGVTPEEHQLVHVRHFNRVSEAAVFAACRDGLAKLGYSVKSSDIHTGFISAERSGATTVQLSPIRRSVAVAVSTVYGVASPLAGYSLLTHANFKTRDDRYLDRVCIVTRPSSGGITSCSVRITIWRESLAGAFRPTPGSSLPDATAHRELMEQIARDLGE